MRYFIDTEFVSRGCTIDLVSVGIAAENGRELYLQSCEFDPNAANDFVKSQVFPHLHTCSRARKHEEMRLSDVSFQVADHRDFGGNCGRPGCIWRTREQIRDEIRAFVGDATPEFWGDYCAFDFVAISQLFGQFENWPACWPFGFFDIRQLAASVEGLVANWEENILPPEKAHHALSDAKVIRHAHDYLTHYGRAVDATVILNAGPVSEEQNAEGGK